MFSWTYSNLAEMDKVFYGFGSYYSWISKSETKFTFDKIKDLFDQKTAEVVKKVTEEGASKFLLKGFYNYVGDASPRYELYLQKIDKIISE